jgi:hypothetical protein
MSRAHVPPRRPASDPTVGDGRSCGTTHHQHRGHPPHKPAAERPRAYGRLATGAGRTGTQPPCKLYSALRRLSKARLCRSPPCSGIVHCGRRPPAAPGVRPDREWWSCMGRPRQDVSPWAREVTGAATPLASRHTSALPADLLDVLTVAKRTLGEILRDHHSCGAKARGNGAESSPSRHEDFQSAGKVGHLALRRLCHVPCHVSETVTHSAD